VHSHPKWNKADRMTTIMDFFVSIFFFFEIIDLIFFFFFKCTQIIFFDNALGKKKKEKKKKREINVFFVPMIWSFDKKFLGFQKVIKH
jgi:hypothetical protein